MIDREPSSLDVGFDPSGSGGAETFDSRPIGEYLRRQRVLRGISTEELSSLTRIPQRSIERLESGQFDGEYDGFVRGFVRTVATALGLDADDAITRMLREPAPGTWERHSSNRGLKQALAGVVLLALVAVAAIGLRAAWLALVDGTSSPGSRAVVIWHDPVRALAEATGVSLDPSREIDPLPTEPERVSASSRSASTPPAKTP